jgi:hypothetical protein
MPQVPDIAFFERIIGGVYVDFEADLEGIIGDSDKTRERNLVATEKPVIIENEPPFERIHVSRDQIHEGAVAYSASEPKRYKDGKIAIALTYYREGSA